MLCTVGPFLTAFKQTEFLVCLSQLRPMTKKRKVKKTIRNSGQSPARDGRRVPYIRLGRDL